MKVVGLTGGIGSGKSTVAAYFRGLGVSIYNSDQQAKRLMIEDPVLQAHILELLGDQAYVNGTLNRPWIAKQVFAESSLLLALNALVHPAVLLDFIQWKSAIEASNDSDKNVRIHYMINEVAIIFETGTQDRYDKTILVTAPERVRIQRVIRRDGMNAADVRKRMANQWPDAKKIPLADYVLINNDLARTQHRVQKLHEVLNK